MTVATMTLKTHIFIMKLLTFEQVHFDVRLNKDYSNNYNCYSKWEAQKLGFTNVDRGSLCFI